MASQTVSDVGCRQVSQGQHKRHFRRRPPARVMRDEADSCLYEASPAATYYQEGWVESLMEVSQKNERQHQRRFGSVRAGRSQVQPPCSKFGGVEAWPNFEDGRARVSFTLLRSAVVCEAVPIPRAEPPCNLYCQDIYHLPAPPLGQALLQLLPLLSEHRHFAVALLHKVISVQLATGASSRRRRS